MNNLNDMFNDPNLAVCLHLNFYSFDSITDATIYVGGLDDKVTDTLLWELFVQAGSVGKYTYIERNERFSIEFHLNKN